MTNIDGYRHDSGKNQKKNNLYIENRIVWHSRGWILQIVVTIREEVSYSKKQGYVTEEYMDTKEIASVTDSRFQKAFSGRADTSYNLKNVILVGKED